MYIFSEELSMGEEDIISLPRDKDKEYPFCLEMAGISYCDGTYRIERKNSQVYVFEYVLKGKGTVVIKDPDAADFIASEGDIYILHRNSSHFYFADNNEPWTKVWFNIYGPLIDNLMKVYNLGDIHHVQNLDLRDLFFEMLTTAKSPIYSTEQIFNKSAVIFHKIVIRIYSELHRSESRYSPEASILRNYLDKQVEKDINILELGHLIFRSPSQTIRIFRKAFGVTPYNYLLTKKIEAAKILLINTNMSVKSIAYKLNFADEHYFSNYFKSKVGIPPSTFRYDQ